MADLHLSLFEVFERLRRRGVPLGVSDYLLAIEAIQAGVGLEDAANFKELFRLLWSKSKEDQELFDLAFAELVEPQLRNISIAEALTTSTSESSQTTNTETVTNDELPHNFPKTRSRPEPEPEPEPEPKQKTQVKRVILPSKSVELSLVLKTELINEPHYYQLTPRLAITRRDMAGVWRQIRRLQRAGVPQELDVKGTINSISRSGLFLRPLLQPRRRNQARLVVLVDQQGSMAPFVLLIEAVIESILRSGLLGKVSLYYFHDCPEGFLYQRPSLTDAVPLEVVLNQQAKDNGVVIISDGGSARGYYDRIRVLDTKVFLKALSTYTYLYVWLNPMPQSRWVGTTAEDIKCMVPMYPLDREGLNDAVSILRGHPFPAGVGIDE